MIYAYLTHLALALVWTPTVFLLIQDNDERDGTNRNQQQNQEAKAELADIDTASLIERNDTPVGDQNIRFHIWNGLIIGGDLIIDHIDVETEFGALRIPISKIQRFYPGLDSYPELEAQIAELIEDLGNPNFEVREQSHAQLVQFGALVRLELDRFDGGNSVERKKHLNEIKKKIDDMLGELDEVEMEQVERPLIRSDRIQTDQFTIVGKIVQPEFRLTSKYGDMVVQLSDIKMADRSFNITAGEVRRTVEVDVMSFFPDGVSTKIRVNRGDRITINAGGSMNWTNWNSSCGPEGMSDKGQFYGHNSGMLLAQIGDGQDYIRIGPKGTFTANRSGVLKLGVAMADNFSRNSGYRWTGNYTAKIVVQPRVE